MFNNFNICGQFGDYLWIQGHLIYMWLQSCMHEEGKMLSKHKCDKKLCFKLAFKSYSALQCNM